MAISSMRVWRRIALSIVASVLILIGAIAAGIWIAPVESVHLAYKIGRRWAHVERHDIKLDEESHFAYLEGGEGEPLLLLHGFGGNKDYFLPFASYLTPHYRVIIPDLIGFGDSSHPPQADYSALAQAERLHALLQALGVSRVHVGGTSSGAQIALTYAARYPDQTASVLAIGAPGVAHAKLSVLQQERLHGRNPMLISDADDMRRLLALLTENPPWFPRPLLAALGAERIRDRRLQEYMTNQRRPDPLEVRVAGLEMPVLLEWGSADKLVDPDAGRVLHDILPNSRLLIKPGIGHSVAIECPQALATDYLGFRMSLPLPKQ